MTNTLLLTDQRSSHIESCIIIANTSHPDNSPTFTDYMMYITFKNQEPIRFIPFRIKLSEVGATLEAYESLEKGEENAITDQ
jgi:hypothetical protein